MCELILLRYGQSTWNRENRLTGWTDVDLTEQGMLEAHEPARALRTEGLIFDLAFTSFLKRAIRTLWIGMDGLDRMWVPVVRAWQLNERQVGRSIRRSRPGSKTSFERWGVAGVFLG